MPASSTRTTLTIRFPGDRRRTKQPTELLAMPMARECVEDIGEMPPLPRLIVMEDRQQRADGEKTVH